MDVDYCVIGAGFAGLRIARHLEDRGASYVVLDKGRSPGGRAATRRMAGTRFDHGLPWLEDRGRFTAALIDGLRGTGLLREVELTDAGEQAWVSPDGITAITKHLAAGLRIQFERKVDSVEAGSSSALLVGEGDAAAEPLVAKHVVVTAPVPQAARLLPGLFEGVETPTDGGASRKTVLAIAALDSKPDPDLPFLYDDPAPGIERVTVESRKRDSPAESLTIRCDQAASNSLWDAGDDRAWSWIRDRLGDSGLPLDDPQEVQIKKWRYAQCARPVPAPFLTGELGSARVSACGDGFSVPGCDPGLETALGSAQAFCDA